MRIPFRRIGSDPQTFALEKGGIKMEGTLRQYRPSLVLMEAKIGGSMEVDCFRCGDSFDIIPDEQICFLISEGVFRGQDETYDVVEMHEGVIDLDEVLESEIALIGSDYHACGRCR